MKYLKKILIAATKNIVLRNVNRTKYQKKCLLVYITKPFVPLKLNIHHTNYYEARIIAKVIGEFGYNVDVIFMDNALFCDYSSYDMIFGLGNAFMKSLGKCKSGCKKIYYATGACFLSQFHNEVDRWINFYKRKGICMASARFGMPLKPELMLQSILASDAIITVGGKWCISTYSIFNRPIYSVGAIGFSKFSYCTMKRDIDRCKKNFLWLGGKGLIHKGLDLCIEAFSQMPDFHLYIACPKEEPFFIKYKEEIKKSNIHYMNFVNADSVQFYELCNNCVFIILNSCSEGSCTSILTGMYTGLIPIVNEESDISFGYKLNTQSVHEIIDTVEKINTELSDKELLEKMEESYQVVLKNYNKKSFEKKLKSALQEIIDGNDKKGINSISNV